MNASKKKRNSPLSKRIARWRRSLSTPRPPSDRELVEASGLFDAKWYLQKYPDVAAAGVDPLSHYMNDGAREGRKASTRFDARWYVGAYPDAADSDMNPLLHYIRNKKGRVGTLSDLKAVTPEQKSDVALLLANVHFDGDWYAAANGLGKAGRHAALHYLQFGAARGLPPSPSFDGARYLQTYPDIRDAGVNPLLHYIRHGENEGRVAFAIDDPAPAVLSFHTEASKPAPDRPVNWVAGSDLVGDDLSGVLTLGKSPVGLLPLNATGSGLPKRLGQAAEIFCRLTGRPAESLAGIKGRRRKVRLMIGDLPDLNALRAPLDDAWFVSDSRLTLRLKALRGGQSPKDHVLRAYQFVAQGSRLASVGEAKIGSQGGLLALSLENPFLPVLCVICSRDGAVVDGFLLPFPSLYRGGAHAAEAELSGRGSQHVNRVRDYSRTLVQEHLGWDQAQPLVLERIQVDLRQATGNERIFGEQARAWLGEMGIAVTAEHAETLDAGIRSYLVDAVTHETVTKRTGQGLLRLPPDALPSLGVVHSRRMPDGVGSYVICSADEAARPRLFVSLPPMDEAIAHLQPVAGGHPYPSLSDTGVPVSKRQHRSSLLAIRFLPDAPPIPATLAFAVDEATPRPLVEGGRASRSTRERMTAVIRATSSDGLHRLLRSLARQSIATRLDVVLAVDEDVTLPEDLGDAFAGSIRRVDGLRGASPAAALNHAVQDVQTPWMLLLDQHVVLHDFRTLETLRALAGYRRAATVSCMRIRQAGFRDGAPLVFHSAGSFPAQIDLQSAPGLTFTSPVTTEAFPRMTYPVAANGLEFALVSRKAWDELGGLDAEAYPFEGYGLAFCLNALRAGWTHLNTTGISAMDTVRRLDERADALGVDVVSIEDWGTILARTAQIRRLD